MGVAMAIAFDEFFNAYVSCALWASTDDNGEPMDIYVNGYLIAQGEVVVVEDKYGIRLTDIITPSERLNRLNSRR